MQSTKLPIGMDPLRSDTAEPDTSTTTCSTSRFLRAPRPAGSACAKTPPGGSRLHGRPPSVKAANGGPSWPAFAHWTFRRGLPLHSAPPPGADTVSTTAGTPGQSAVHFSFRSPGACSGHHNPSEPYHAERRIFRGPWPGAGAWVRRPPAKLLVAAGAWPICVTRSWDRAIGFAAS